MPSGFQQDTNQLQPNYYRVQIDMSNASYYATSLTPSNSDNGGCTPNNWDFFSAGNLPTTLNSGIQRARGVLRFKNIARELSALADCQIVDITITEANADAQATTLSFSVKYDRDSFINITGTKIGTATVGNDAANNPMDTKAKVIANAVATALYVGRTETMSVYDPTTNEGKMLSVTANATTTNANILGTITVSLVDTVTVINS
jgi:hypothetical protein